MATTRDSHNQAGQGSGEGNHSDLLNALRHIPKGPLFVCAFLCCFVVVVFFARAPRSNSLSPNKDDRMPSEKFKAMHKMLSEQHPVGSTVRFGGTTGVVAQIYEYSYDSWATDDLFVVFFPHAARKQAFTTMEFANLLESGKR